MCAPVDQQESPLYLMQHPMLFKRSMKKEYFTMPKFVIYLLYSLFHAIVIYFLCFHLFSAPNMQPDGKGIGMWIPGHLVYGSCIIAANLMLVMRFNNYTVWGELLAYLMILSYFSTMSLESQASLYMVPDLHYLFEVMFSLGLVWLQMLAVGAIVVALELGYFYVYRALFNDEKAVRDEEK